MTINSVKVFSHLRRIHTMLRSTMTAAILRGLAQLPRVAAGPLTTAAVGLIAKLIVDSYLDNVTEFNVPPMDVYFGSSPIPYSLEDETHIRGQIVEDLCRMVRQNSTFLFVGLPTAFATALSLMQRGGDALTHRLDQAVDTWRQKSLIPVTGEEMPLTDTPSSRRFGRGESNV
jgi:hypothetical protein